MKTSLPRLSIIVPSYQQGPFIERTIKSIVDQEYPDLELILMDGGSTDETMAIVEKYRSHFTHIISRKDAGQADAIRRGFAMATGEIMGWLNSDDTYVPSTLIKMGAYFRDHPEVRFAYGNNNYIDSQDRVMVHKVQPRCNLGVMKYAYLTVPQMSAFWKRDLYESSGGVDATLRFCMDYDLFIKMAMRSLPSHMGFTIGNFRLHDLSKTRSMEAVRQTEDLLVQSRYCSVKPNQKILFKLTRRYYQLVAIWLFLLNGSLFGRVKTRFSNGMKSLASQ